MKIIGVFQTDAMQKVIHQRAVIPAVRLKAPHDQVVVTKDRCQLVQPGCVLKQVALIFQHFIQTFVKGLCGCSFCVLDILFPDGDLKLILTS